VHFADENVLVIQILLADHRKIAHYNFDVIIAIGSRIQSFVSSQGSVGGV
jgi:hypothetical protein